MPTGWEELLVATPRPVDGGLDEKQHWVRVQIKFAGYWINLELQQLTELNIKIWFCLRKLDALSQAFSSLFKQHSVVIHGF
mmetsp:Transcript_8988/g.14419  ORF Transcript_8988/g.14419 Transcript_8988/m.14419 type:complete len:81 (+) Transcript_8988:174-416(+)